MPRRAAFDKVFRNKAFNIAKNSKLDGCQRRLASIVSKVFEKMSATSGVAIKIDIMSNQNEHKNWQWLENLENVYLSFKDKILDQFYNNKPFAQYGYNICLHLSGKGLLDVQGSYFLAHLRIFGVFSYVSVKTVVVFVFSTSQIITIFLIWGKMTDVQFGDVIMTIHTI